MIVWCHAQNCEALIRNDQEHLGTPAGNRTYVDVSGVPFCLGCYDDDLPQPHVAGVPVRDEDVTLVLGGYPPQGQSV